MNNLVKMICGYTMNKQDMFKAQILTRFFDEPNMDNPQYYPRPFGVIYQAERATYEEQHRAQIELAVKQKGSGDLNALIQGKSVWDIG